MRDVMNPPGMFLEGVRQREYSSANDPLPLSGKLIPEFFGRRNIRDMFARKPPLQPSQSTNAIMADADDAGTKEALNDSSSIEPSPAMSESTSIVLTPPPVLSASSASIAGHKRPIGDISTNKSLKRVKSGSAATAPAATGKGQQSLKGFFKPKANATAGSPSIAEDSMASEADSNDSARRQDFQSAAIPTTTTSHLSSANGTARTQATWPGTVELYSANSSPTSGRSVSTKDQDTVHDPIMSKESWSRLFTKPAAPRCEGHDEPCITLLTKKPGMNLGRSFWMCPRPLGPSGAKEKNTQWRCQTFIWCSDWNSTAANGG